MAPTFIMSMAYEINLVGFGILLLTLVPLTPIQNVGHFIVKILFKIRVANPFAAADSAWRGTISLPLTVAAFAALCSLYSLVHWWRHHEKAIANPKMRLQDLDMDQLARRWREERNAYLWLVMLAIYLSLHTIGRIILSREQKASVEEAKKNKDAPGPRVTEARPSAMQ